MDSSIMELTGMIFSTVGVSGKAGSMVGLSGMIFCSVQLSRMGFSWWDESCGGQVGNTTKNTSTLSIMAMVMLILFPTHVLKLL